IAGRARAAQQQAHDQEDRHDEGAGVNTHSRTILMRRTVALSIFGNSVGSPTSFSHWAGQSPGTVKSPAILFPAKVTSANGRSSKVTLSGRAQVTRQNIRCWTSWMSPSTWKPSR